MSTNSILLTIPCFNESGRVQPFLEELAATLPEGSAVIQLVDDGSGPEEQARLLQVTAAVRAEHPNLFAQPLLLEKNRGKGGAVYAGWAAADRQDWLMFADADGSCSAAEILRLINHALSRNQPNKAWFASRIKMLGRRVDRLLSRHLVGRVYATLVSNLLNVEVYDSQCGLKLVPRGTWEAIRPMLETTGFAFDAELLVALLDTGVAVEEFPIDWHETPGGKVHVMRDSVRMAKELLRMRERRQSSTWKKLANDAKLSLPK